MGGYCYIGRTRMPEEMDIGVTICSPGCNSGHRPGSPVSLPEGTVHSEHSSQSSYPIRVKQCRQCNQHPPSTGLGMSPTFTQRLLWAKRHFSKDRQCQKGQGSPQTKEKYHRSCPQNLPLLRGQSDSRSQSWSNAKAPDLGVVLGQMLPRWERRELTRIEEGVMLSRLTKREVH